MEFSHSLLIGRLIKSQRNIRSIKSLTKDLAQKGLQLNLDGKLFPVSPYKSARLSLFSAGLIDDAGKIRKMLKVMNGLKIDEYEKGYVDLKDVLKQFKQATLGMKQSLKEISAAGVASVDTEALIKDIVKDALAGAVKSPDTEKVALLLKSIMPQSDSESLVHICTRIVRAAKTFYGGANPTLVLKGLDDEGNRYILPVAVALPESAITLGQWFLKKNLGATKILAKFRQENFYVNAVEWPELKVWRDVPQDDAKKIIGDFVDTTYTTEGELGQLFKIAVIPEPNSLLTVPLKRTNSETGKPENIGVLAIFKKGGFSEKEKTEISLFAKLAELIIASKKDREALEQQVEELRRTKGLAALGQVAPIISHRLKNGLFGMLGAVDAAIEAARDLNLIKELPMLPGHSSDARDRLYRSKHEELMVRMELVKRLNSISSDDVQQILQIARIGEGKEEVIPLKRFVNEVMESYLGKAENIGVRINVEFFGIGEDTAVRIVRSGLRDLLENPLKNAIEAFGGEAKGKRIDLKIERKKAELVISVEDNAGGMNDEIMKNLCELGTAGKRGGTGYGMFIVKSTAEKLKGKLDVISSLGAGTIIRIMLPSGIIEEKKMEAPPMDRTKASGVFSAILSREKAAAIRMMVIEDDPNVMATIRMMLSRMGFKDIFAFESPRSALEFLREGKARPGIIICDQSLPGGILGHQFFREADKIFTLSGEAGRPSFVIFSGDEGPKNEDAERTIKELSVKWLDKGRIAEFDEAIARIAMGVKLKSEEYMASRKSDDRPVVLFLRSLMHKINNINLYILPAAEYGKAEMIKQYSRNFMENMAALTLGLDKFVFSEDAKALCSSLQESDREGFMKLISGARGEHGLDGFILAAAMFLESGFRDFYQGMNDILSKEKLEPKDFERIKELGKEISSLGGAIVGDARAPEDLREKFGRFLNMVSEK